MSQCKTGKCRRAAGRRERGPGYLRHCAALALIVEELMEVEAMVKNPNDGGPGPVTHSSEATMWTTNQRNGFTGVLNP